MGHVLHDLNAVAVARALLGAEQPAPRIRLRGPAIGILPLDEQVFSPNMYGDLHPPGPAAGDLHGGVQGVVHQVHEQRRQILVGDSQGLRQVGLGAKRHPRVPGPMRPLDQDGVDDGVGGKLYGHDLPGLLDEDGKVEVPGGGSGGGGDITITPPAGGSEEDRKVTVDEDGKVEISKGGSTSELEVPAGGSVPTDSSKLHDVSGSVQEHGGAAVSGATVELRQGVNRLASTTTDEQGAYIFHNIPNGVYNIVATAGAKTKTQMVILNRDLETLTLTMPSDNVNSVLEVVGPPASSGEKPTAAAVEKTVVGGLDEEAEAQKEENATVTVTMKVEKKEEHDAAGAEQIRNESASEATKLEFLDITVNKTVTRDEADSTERLSMTSVVIEIVVPFNFAGKTKDSIAVYRFHEDKAEALQKGEDRQDGVFMLDMENGLIHIFANRFSTYAIGYEEEGAHQHVWSEEWSHGETHHWHECKADGCPVTDNSKKDGYGAHVYDGSEDAVCNTCGYVRTPPAPEPPSDSQDSRPTYAPKVEQPDHGTVTIRPKAPEQGDRVTITLTPDEGYQPGSVTVTDRNGKSVTVTVRGDGTYTFTQPRGAVTVTAVFEPVPDPVFDCPRDRTCPIWPYTDSDTNAWYHDGVHYCLAHKLMIGLDSQTFAPGADTSRAMIAMILWRLEGSPAADSVLAFGDVAQDAWYAQAVRWAAESGVVKGYDSVTFGPDDPITREQLAAMLYRFAQYRDGAAANGGVSRLDFDDAGQVSDWAYEAMCWSVGSGIILGVGDDLLQPLGYATRAQAAVMIMRFQTKR